MKLNLRFIAVFLFTIVSISSWGNSNSREFHIDRISDNLEAKLINSGIWKQGCPVSLNDLRIISVNYYDLRGHLHRDGKIILHKSVANDALKLFRKFYLHHFPFSSIETLNHYQGNWKQAEEDNVSYGFICKPEAKNGFSAESSGKVITLNPVFNPQISLMTKQEQNLIIQPMRSIFSVNRKLKLNGMTESAESILKSSGFTRLKLPGTQLGWNKFIFQEKTNIEHPFLQQNYYLTQPMEKSVTPPTFTSSALSTALKEKLKLKKYWDSACPVPLERLILLTISYYDFAGKIRTGNLIVFDATAPYFLNAFKEFYNQKFPLEEVLPISETDRKDLTLAFNCRNIVGESMFSLHSYGLAIDINILRNPYAGAYKKNNAQMQMLGKIIPSGTESLSYLNRSQKRPGMNEAIVKIMKRQGFIEWGGNWQDRVDYMHFQVPKSIAENMTQLDIDSGKELMNLVIKYPEAAEKMSSDERWTYLYQLYPQTYMQALKKYFPRLKIEKEITVINRIYSELANS